MPSENRTEAQTFNWTQFVIVKKVIMADDKKMTMKIILKRDRWVCESPRSQASLTVAMNHGPWLWSNLNDHENCQDLLSQRDDNEDNVYEGQVRPWKRSQATVMSRLYLCQSEPRHWHCIVLHCQSKHALPVQATAQCTKSALYCTASPTMHCSTSAL